MSNWVLDFSRAHPDPSPGYSAALARLEKSLAEAEVLAARQGEGINAVRSATSQKRVMRRKIRRNQLVHFAAVAESAAGEAPDIAQKFRLTREGVPYLAFRTAARGMLAEAQSQKELLVRHGLLDSAVQTLSQSMDQFDTAGQQGIEGRRAHVGARAELDAIADEAIQIVRYMDGLNRFRFASDPESLAGWQSNSNIFGPPRSTATKPTPGSPPQGGEIKPAA